VVGAETSQHDRPDTALSQSLQAERAGGERPGERGSGSGSKSTNKAYIVVFTALEVGSRGIQQRAGGTDEVSSRR
jgi:hypothetical protein